MAAVNRNMFEACLVIEKPQGPSLLVLPLNLIALIVTSLDDPGDLARLCRTCRVLNYMALPQLYKNMVLTSYDKIRYRGDEPEGMGSASPFSMGLNAVITRPFASVVRSLTLRGEWREQELEEHARIGRVPESSMMLNIAVRAAVDRMSGLESFHWELNTKMLETVYMGLAQMPKLTSLTVRFPSSRHPRPTCVIPAMPHLRYLKITDIDPLCYPDDISTLLWKARKLVELKLHWSSRMRNMQEPSVVLHEYFRKLVSAKQALGVKKLGFQNLYARHSQEFFTAFDFKTLEEVTFLNEASSDPSGSLNTFLDSTWPVVPRETPLRLKSIRQDVLTQKQLEFYRNFTGFERIYFVSATNSYDDINCQKYTTPPKSLSPPASDHTMPPSNDLVAPSLVGTSPQSPSLLVTIRDTFLNSFVLNHAATIRHLLLPARWPLSSNTIARIVHASPQLEQLAFAAETASIDTQALLLPFLRNLVALRFLVPQGGSAEPADSRSRHTKSHLHGPNGESCFHDDAKSLAEYVELDDEIIAERIGVSLGDQQILHQLKVLGIGRKGFLLGEYYTVAADQEQQSGGVQSQTPTESCATSVEANGNQDESPLSSLEGSYQHEHENCVGGVGFLSSAPNRPHSNSPRGAAQQRSPHSLLGKRTRDDEFSTVPSDRVEANDSNMGGQCGPYFMNGSKSRFWRRRVRRVGWDVLKKWEIWGLDTYEL